MAQVEPTEATKVLTTAETCCLLRCSRSSLLRNRDTWKLEYFPLTEKATRYTASSVENLKQRLLAAAQQRAASESNA